MAITIRPWQFCLQRSVASAWSVMAVTLMLPHRAGAAEWAFVPTLLLRESYSDNIRLEPPPLAKSELTTEITPGFNLSRDSARLTLNVGYSLQKILYTDEPDRLNHQLQGAGHALLLDDWLFADARASISQQNVSAFGPQLIDNTQITGNQTTVRGYLFSPYLKHDLRGFAATELRYTHESVSSGGSAGLSTDTNEIRLNLTGDNGGRGANWDANFDRRKIDDHARPPVLMSSEALTLHYPIGSTISVFGTGGYEKDDYATSDSAQPAGRFWSAGAAWNPSTRTSVVASVGKRFFGNTYSLDTSYRSHNTVWSLTYGEDITTAYGQFLAVSRNDTSALLNQLWLSSIPDPVARQQSIDAFILLAPFFGPNAGAINYISHQYFLDKRLSLSMALSGPRTTLALSLTRLQRTAQSSTNIDNPLLGTNQLALDDKTRQSNASAAWSWRLSGRSNLHLTTTYSSVDSLATGRTDKNEGLGAGLSHQLSSKVSANVELHHANHSSNTGGNYRENGVSAALNFQF